MWKLYLDYEAEIKLEEPFNPVNEFIALHPSKVSGTTGLRTAKLSFIESVNRTDVYSVDYMLSGEPAPLQPGGVATPGGLNVTIAIRRQGWSTE